jgi:Co/Zn/Cd efflux system component
MSAMCNQCNHDGDVNPQMRKALWVALIINMTMFAVEFSSGWLSGSVGLQADAVDFFGDTANYILSLAVLGMALRW